MSRLAPPLTAQVVAALPKVLLHDHLDGGLRPSTVIELAREAGRPVPEDDPEALGHWFVEQASAGSLEAYLGTFEHTVGVMQTAEQLRRVAREAVEDLAADGVVYAEERYAPELHLAGGLAPQQVVDAVGAGIAEGVASARGDGRRIRVQQILVAMRHGDHSTQIADLALANRGAGVVGFDLAGAEADHPPRRHTRAFRALRTASFPVTVHAGEAAGVDSVAEALHLAGALRLGHGARLVEDITFGEPHAADPTGLHGARLGDVAHWVRDRRVPLEICPSSNLQTGVAPSIGEHPVTSLAQLGFAVTINTDNRLMSGTSMTRELTRLVEEAGWGLLELRDVTVTAARNAFIHHDERTELVEDVIWPAYTPNGRHRA